MLNAEICNWIIVRKWMLSNEVAMMMISRQAEIIRALWVMFLPIVYCFRQTRWTYSLQYWKKSSLCVPISRLLTISTHSILSVSFWLLESRYTLTYVECILLLIEPARLINESLHFYVHARSRTISNVLCSILILIVVVFDCSLTTSAYSLRKGILIFLLLVLSSRKFVFLACEMRLLLLMMQALLWII